MLSKKYNYLSKNFSSTIMNYRLAPIREAILDIKIKGLNIKTPEDLNKFHEKIIAQYPEGRKKINIQGEFELKDGIGIKNKSISNLAGYIYSNKKTNTQVQIKTDGYTFNMLKPYSNWNDFSNEAFRLWEIYNQIFEPQKVNRIALRYINRIDIPLPVNSFQDYIINMPPIPNSLPKAFNNFFMRIEVPCNNEGTVIALTHTIEKAAEKNLPFILDLDVYQYKKDGIDKEQLKIKFEQLREIKNSTFEDCITEKTREMLK